MNRCVSCDAALTGRYCAECGEKAPEGSDLDWRHYLLEELPHAIFEIDGPLPRTLISLFTRPGELAQAFVSGRRRPFITPVRLYILAFLVYEVTGSLMHHGHPSMNVAERARLIDPTGLLERLLDLRGSAFWENPVTEARLSERGRWLSELGTFIIAVFLAIFQSAVFLSMKRRFLEHLALAVNVTTFFLLTTTLGQGLVFVFSRSINLDVDAAVQTFIALIALPIYWFFSTKRFYGIGSPWAGLSAVVMTAGAAGIALLINIVVLAMLILTA